MAYFVEDDHVRKELFIIVEKNMNNTDKDINGIFNNCLSSYKLKLDFIFFLIDNDNDILLSTILESPENYSFLNCKFPYSGNTPIMQAFYSNACKVIRLLLGLEKVDINIINNYGKSTLHFAAGHDYYNNNFDILLLVIKKTSNVNILSNDRHIPLEDAAIWNKKDTSLLLIEIGSDIELLTPLYKKVCYKWIIETCLSKKILNMC
jgi:ankyrin repeat protein